MTVSDRTASASTGRGKGTWAPRQRRKLIDAR